MQGCPDRYILGTFQSLRSVWAINPRSPHQWHLGCEESLKTSAACLLQIFHPVFAEGPTRASLFSWYIISRQTRDLDETTASRNACKADLATKVPVPTWGCFWLWLAHCDEEPRGFGGLVTTSLNRIGLGLPGGCCT